MATLNVRSLANPTTRQELTFLGPGVPGAPLDADVLVFTETRLDKTRAKSGFLRALLRGYKLYHTCKDKEGDGLGVTVAIRKTYLVQVTVVQRELPATLKGQAVHLTVVQEQCPTWHILGAYLSPSQGVEERTAIYEELAERVIGPALQHQQPVVAAGDWNATASPEGRPSGTNNSLDRAHQRFIKTYDLKPVGNDSTPTHQTGSRIDDVLIIPGAGAVKTGAAHAARVLHNPASLLDHWPLVASINPARAGIVPPRRKAAPDREPTTRLVTPVRKEDAQRTKDKIMLKYQQEIEGLHAELSRLTRGPVEAHWDSLAGENAGKPHPLTHINGCPAKEGVDRLAEMLMHILTGARDMALQECPTKLVGAKRQHYRRRRPCRQRKRLAAQRAAIREVINNLQRGQEVAGMDALPEAAKEILQEGQDPDRINKLQDMAKEVRGQISTLDKEEVTHAAQESKKRNEAFLAANRKLATQAVLDPPDERINGNLTVLRDREGSLTTEPEKIKEVVGQFYRDLLAPPKGCKTGKYLPEDAPRDYPWKTGLDAFVLESAAPSRTFLREKMEDDTLFREVLNTLSTGKAPGPDQVTNEVIKMLPDEALDCIKLLFRVMWATGVTPNAWKPSNTVLIYKNKGATTDVGNYRPISLANTVYKLWTRMITYSLADYAEKHAMLSRAQGGFRARRGTSHQLQLMVETLEDAWRNKQDVLALLVDFSSAFNMINQDKLLMVMYDLGFPTDALEVVKDLYTGATTTMVTPYGPTSPIEVQRGTLQGDSLSPFLFLIYLEPLLRWLHSGARGYQMGDLQGQDKVKYHQSSVAYADDLTILAPNPTQLKAQAEKLSQWAEWADMKVQHRKTLVTGALHSVARDLRRPNSNGSLVHKAKLRAILHDRILVQGRPVTYLDPDAPFTLLGVQFTALLDWGHQFRAALRTAREKAKRVTSTRAQWHKLYMVRHVLRPAVTYPMVVAPYTPQQVEALDKVLTKAVKISYQQRACTGSALAREDLRRGGLGATSIAVDYCRITGRTLMEALRSKAVLGAVARATAARQTQWAHGCTCAQQPEAARVAMRLRQMSILRAVGLQATKEGEDFCPLIGTPLTGLLHTLHTGRAKQSWGKINPAQVVKPLLELGVTSFTQLCEQDGCTILDGAALTRALPGVGRIHRQAIDRLAGLMNAQPEGEEALTLAVLPRHPSKMQRRIHPDYLAEVEAQAPAPLGPLEGPPIARHCRRAPGAPRRPPAPVPESAARILGERGVAEDKPKPMKAGGKGKGPKNGSRTSERVQRKALPTGRTTGTPRPEYSDVAVNRPVSANVARGGQAVPDKGEGARPTDPGAPSAADTSRYERALACFTKGRRTLAAAARALAAAGGGSTFGVDKLDGMYVIQEKGCEQRCFKVHWEPSYHQQWEIDLYQELGYEKIGEPEPWDPEENISPDDDTPCEVCGDSHPLPDRGNGAEHALLCDGCDTAWHGRCLNPPICEIPEGRWYCPQCERHKAASPDRGLDEAPHVRACKVYRVTFAPSLEMESQLREDGFGEEVDRYLSMQNTPAQELRPDALFTNAQRQGVWGPDADSVYWKTIGEEIRKKVEIRHKAIHPHLSTVPTGRFNVQIRRCARFEPKVLGSGRDPDDYDVAPSTRLAAICDPDGDPVGTLELRRLAILKSRYEAVKEEAPLTHERHSAGYFEADLAALLRRYRQGAKIVGKDGRVKLENHWTTPPRFFAALKNRFGLKKERFASPLNFNPSLGEYWSVHPEDALFGAHHDAYGCKWTGPSQANAEYEHADLFKAMRWAVHSAATGTDTASFTLLIHPAWDQRSDTSYNRWLHERGDAATVLMRIPRHRFMFCRPTRWADAEAMAGNPKWDVNVVLVANRAGMRAHYGPDTNEKRLELSASIAAALNEECVLAGDVEAEEVLGWWRMPVGWTPAEDETLHQRSVTTPAGPMARPKKLAKARLDTSLHTDYTYQQCATDGELEDLYPALPLAMDWTALAYTDGSYISRDEEGRQKLAGAGVYIPKQDGPYQPGSMMGQGHRMVLKPGPAGYTNTITRAELVAIYKFLVWARETHEHLGVATDSAASMHLISKVTREPHHFYNHKHRGILWKVMEEIKSRTTPLRVYKVKSHSGIVGNELADIAARRGATIEGAEMVEEGAAPHLEDDHPYWLRHTPIGGDSAGQPQVVGDLGKQLAKICHDELRLGGANLESKYYQAMREAAPGVLLDISNKWRAAQDVPPAMRRLAMAYHSGMLHCQAVEYREGRVETPSCLLCGQYDGRQHVVSGCPAVRDMVTERHHGAVRMIAKETMKGRHGTGMVMMDAGRLEKRMRDGVELATSIPDWMFPASLPQQERNRLKKTLKPDILLYTKEGGGKRRRDSRRKGTVARLVEVKYCKDTDKSGQEERAENQHAELKGLLEEAGYEVHQHTILLGVGGTIFKETPGDLEALGLAKPRALRLMERLSKYAVETMQTIIHMKRAKETEALKAAGTWKRWGPRKDQWEPVVRKQRGKKKGIG